MTGLAKSVLYVRLPCWKIYPGGAIYVADYIHKQRPDIKQEILDRRTPGIMGQVCGIVGGHGGDVYWVRHDGTEDTGSAYGWWEFELVQGDPKPEPPTRYDLLRED